MRARIVLAGSFVAAALGAAAACGIDESGTANDASTDMVVVDVGPDGPSDAPIDVPQACSTLDTTACVDAAIPSGWTFAAVAFSPQSCPSPAYAQAAYIYDAGVGQGACDCKCTTQGDYSCTGTLTVGGNNAPCGATIVMDAGPDGCVDTNWSDHHGSADWSPTVTGTPTCTASLTGDAGMTSASATSCTPGCDASDFCSLASPFNRCIVSNTSTSCPTQGPFTQKLPSLSTNANVSVACQGCACGVSAPGACTASVTAHDAPACGGSHTFPLTSTCTDTGHGFASFSYEATTPSATCSISDGGTGSVVVGSAITVCCIP